MVGIFGVMPHALYVLVKLSETKWRMKLMRMLRHESHDIAFALFTMVRSRPGGLECGCD